MAGVVPVGMFPHRQPSIPLKPIRLLSAEAGLVEPLQAISPMSGIMEATLQFLQARPLEGVGAELKLPGPQVDLVEVAERGLPVGTLVERELLGKVTTADPVSVVAETTEVVEVAVEPPALVETVPSQMVVTADPELFGMGQHIVAGVAAVFT